MLEGGRMLKNQIPNIKIDSDNVCRFGNELCKNNAKYTCYSCQIMAGSPKFPVRFIPSLTISKPQPDMKSSQPEFNAKELVLPKVPDLKITLPSLEEDEDKPHFVKHLSGVIRHFHTENFRMHKHFECKQLGDFCVNCGIPVIGEIICPTCDSMFNDLDQCFVLADKIFVSYPIYRAL
jgi:hypothetical protein